MICYFKPVTSALIAPFIEALDLVWYFCSIARSLPDYSNLLRLALLVSLILRVSSWNRSLHWLPRDYT